MRTTNTAALVALGVLAVSGCNSGTDVSTAATSTSASSTSTAPSAVADSAYSVPACVDRSGVTYEKDGKPVDNPSGVAAKTLVKHLVVENGGGFRVARDEPGASC